LRIDGKRKDGLALDAAHERVVGHGVGAAGEGANQDDAVYLVVQAQDGADYLAVDDPGQRVGELEALLQGLLVVVAVGEQHARFHFLKHVNQGRANEIVVDHVGVRRHQDAQGAFAVRHLRDALQELRLLAGAFLVVFLLGMHGGGVGLLRLFLACAELLSQLNIGILLFDVGFAVVDLARDDAGLLRGEGVGNQIGQGLEFGAEAFEVAQVVDAGREDGIAFAQKAGNVTHIELRCQAAFVDGKVRACFEGAAVGLAAYHNIPAQLLEEGAPHGFVAEIEQRARNANGLHVGVLCLHPEV